MKRLIILFLMIISIISSGEYLAFFDTLYGVGVGYGQDGWNFWIGYPYAGTSIDVKWKFFGLRASGGFDAFSGKRSWGYGKFYIDTNIIEVDGGIKFGYDETNITENASPEELPTVGDISFVLSSGARIWKNFEVRAGLIYPFLVYKYINDVEKSFIPPPAFLGPLPFDTFLGVSIREAFFKIELLYFIRFSTVVGYPSPLFNMNNLQISIKLYQ